MSWRDAFVNHFASGYLGGIPAETWLRLLWANRFSVSPSCWMRALATTALSPANSVLRQAEWLRFGRAIEATSVAPPLFVLGHFRSGTTHLQQLLAADPRFASPTLYQVFFPHTFLSTEALNAQFVQFFLPRIRGFDNVRQHAQMPHEDEIAMCTVGGYTSYLSFTFPRRADYYDRFLTFQQAEEFERQRWSKGLMWLLKKLTYRHGKPLVLKSPPHTCRIALLLQMFPNAKFVHIHRDPYTVFQSTMHLHRRALKLTRLQHEPAFDWEERTLRLYREMYDVYFQERNMIPSGHLCEVAFDDLERDPIGQLQRIYQDLSLPAFEECESSVRDYLATVGDYKRNQFSELSRSHRDAIFQRWQPSFENWNYPRELTA